MINPEKNVERKGCFGWPIPLVLIKLLSFLRKDNKEISLTSTFLEQKVHTTQTAEQYIAISEIPVTEAGLALRDAISTEVFRQRQQEEMEKLKQQRAKNLNEKKAQARERKRILLRERQIAISRALRELLTHPDIRYAINFITDTAQKNNSARNELIPILRNRPGLTDLALMNDFTGQYNVGFYSLNGAVSNEPLVLVNYTIVLPYSILDEKSLSDYTKGRKTIQRTSAEMNRHNDKYIRSQISVVIQDFNNPNKMTVRVSIPIYKCIWFSNQSDYYDNPEQMDLLQNDMLVGKIERTLTLSIREGELGKQLVSQVSVLLTEYIKNNTIALENSTILLRNESLFDVDGK